MATQLTDLQSHEHVHEDNDDRLNTREAFHVPDDDQAPADAVEAPPMAVMDGSWSQLAQHSYSG